MWQPLVPSVVAPGLISDALGQRFSTCGPQTSAWWSTSKAIFFIIFNDISTQTDQFWQFSMAEFSVVVHDRQTKCESGPRVSKGLRTAALGPIKIIGNVKQMESKGHYHLLSLSVYNNLQQSWWQVTRA